METRDGLRMSIKRQPENELDTSTPKSQIPGVVRTGLGCGATIRAGLMGRFAVQLGRGDRSGSRESAACGELTFLCAEHRSIT